MSDAPSGLVPKTSGKCRHPPSGRIDVPNVGFLAFVGILLADVRLLQAHLLVSAERDLALLENDHRRLLRAVVAPRQRAKRDP
jgi:hypothetical protein